MKRFGLFIGIDKYKNGITSLKCAVSDAKALTAEFAKAQFDSVESLLNEEAHCETILDQVETMVSEMQSGDLFLFYFSGHGREFGNTHYLLGPTARANTEFYQRGSISLPELISISNRPGIHRLFILDCCRSNILSDRDGSFSCDAARDISLNAAVRPHANNSIIPPLILSSCSTGEQAFENQETGHGYFTETLIQSVKNQKIKSFQQFQGSLNLINTPKPQNICWNGNIANWRNISLFANWDRQEVFEPSPDSVVKYELPFLKEDVEKMLSKAGTEKKSEVERYLTMADQAEKNQDYVTAKHFLRSAIIRLKELSEEKKKPVQTENSREKTEQKIKVEQPIREKVEPESEKEPNCKTIILPGNVELDLIKIPAGTFMMGCYEGLIGLINNNAKLHQVTLTKDFWLGKFQITQAQWKALMGFNPSLSQENNHPVENVSWEDARNFCKKLSEYYADKLPDGYRFELPTEAQWEYACRAGSTTHYSYGNNFDMYKMNIGWDMVDVGSMGYKNDFGLYDMHGNVNEWCLDWYNKYSASAVEDPLAKNRSFMGRVTRGGSCRCLPHFCRSWFRATAVQVSRSRLTGFRVALSSGYHSQM